MKSSSLIPLLGISLVLSACGAPTTPLPEANRAAATPQLQSQAAADKAASNEILVKYRPGRAGTAPAEALLRQVGAQRMRTMGKGAMSLDLVKVSGQASRALKDLQQNPAVEYAEQVFTVPFPKLEKSTIKGDETSIDMNVYPNDPMFARQYAHRIAQSQRGWIVNRGDRRIVLAIVDSGVDIKHPDLRAKVIGSYNSADNTPEAVDFIGHGTHVAGIAAAIGNNGLGIIGSAPECAILAVKVASGDTSFPTTAGIAGGILYAVERGAHVINLSLGSSRESKAITDAVNFALSKGVTVVVAMGNDGASVKSWPAAVPGVIAVGSTDARDLRSRFSNFGEWISISAPGSDIFSTLPLNQNQMGAKDYGSMSGTSMATPFVTGLAGLIKSKYPTMRPLDVKRAIESSADDLGRAGFDPEFGHGRVNLGKALLRAAELSHN
jgi:thermitase